LYNSSRSINLVFAISPSEAIYKIKFYYAAPILETALNPAASTNRFSEAALDPAASTNPFIEAAASRAASKD